MFEECGIKICAQITNNKHQISKCHEKRKNFCDVQSSKCGCVCAIKCTVQKQFKSFSPFEEQD